MVSVQNNEFILPVLVIAEDVPDAGIIRYDISAVVAHFVRVFVEGNMGIPPPPTIAVFVSIYLILIIH